MELDSTLGDLERSVLEVKDEDSHARLTAVIAMLKPLL